jgi:hypothetical protein
MSADTDAQERIDWRALRATIFFGFLVAFFAGIGTFLLFPSQQKITLQNNQSLVLFPRWQSIGLALIFGVFSWGLGIVLGAYIKSVMERKKEQRDLIELTAQAAARTVGGYMPDVIRKLSFVEDRLPKMRELTAFFTDTSHLETHLELLHKTGGGLTWIVAKFISKKLSNDFAREWTFDIHGGHYSGFAGELYKECDQSIYLTSPFTPRQWFLEFLTLERLEEIKNGEHLKEEEIPAHVRDLLAARAEKKRRLVILSDEAWSELVCAHEDGAAMSCKHKYNLLSEFLRINGQEKPIEKRDQTDGLHLGHEGPARTQQLDMRFAKASEIMKIIQHYNPTVDYAIFDGWLSLRWGQEQNEGGGGSAGGLVSKGVEREFLRAQPLRLTCPIGEVEKELVELFAFRDHKHLFKSQYFFDRLAHQNTVGAHSRDVSVGAPTGGNSK